jgi:hypothetical protein
VIGWVPVIGRACLMGWSGVRPGGGAMGGGVMG